MTPVPMIRLSVEGMSYQVVHAFAAHSEECEKAIKAAVAEELKDFDFAAVIKEELHRQLRDAVKKAVANAAASIVYQSPIRNMIEDIARKKVHAAVAKSLEDES